MIPFDGDAFLISAITDTVPSLFRLSPKGLRSCSYHSNDSKSLKLTFRFRFFRSVSVCSTICSSMVGMLVRYFHYVVGRLTHPLQCFESGTGVDALFCHLFSLFQAIGLTRYMDAEGGIQYHYVSLGIGCFSFQDRSNNICIKKG